VLELSRHIEPEAASGEFIGVMRMTAAGATSFMAAFDEARVKYQQAAEFREGRSFTKAYLIDLLQHMIEAGADVRCVSIDGGYMEIDTTEDARLADSWWQATES